jgi:hypothetical protein
MSRKSRVQLTLVAFLFELPALWARASPGVARDAFNAPPDVVIGRNGDIIVAGGHGAGVGARVVKFDKNGMYIKEWDTRGAGPGPFEAPHALAIDSQELESLVGVSRC